jgi:peptidoglycan-N-acetylglucosamine deacetylase
MKLRAAVSCDVDTLESIYKGRGLTRPGGYSGAEFRVGIENFCRFLESFKVKATLFMVGNDFLTPENCSHIQETVRLGHEIANHSMTHPHNFRFLSLEDKECEIKNMDKACIDLTGSKPVGFRAPGWNISDDTEAVLVKNGYIYDSSVHPSIMTPALKLLNWKSSVGRPRQDRTTLGQISYMFSPSVPYRCGPGCLGRSGYGNLVEMPVSVVPYLRLPFWATIHLAAGFGFFEKCLKVFKWAGMPIHYQFHLSDFVEYNDPEFSGQMPAGQNVYVPQALKVSLQDKLKLFTRIMETMVKDYDFITLVEWAEAVKSQ